MGKIKEERFVFVRFNIVDRSVGVSRRQCVLIGGAFNDSFVLDDWYIVLLDGSVVVGILDAFLSVTRKTLLSIHVVGVRNAPI